MQAAAVAGTGLGRRSRVEISTLEPFEGEAVARLRTCQGTPSKGPSSSGGQPLVPTGGRPFLGTGLT